MTDPAKCTSKFVDIHIGQSPDIVRDDASDRLDFFSLVDQMNVKPTVRSLQQGVMFAEFKNPALVDDVSIKRLYQALLPVSEDAFGRDMLGYWNGEYKADTFRSRTRFFLIGTADGRTIGWSGYFILSDRAGRCIFPDMGAVLKEFQSQRILTKLFHSGIKWQLVLAFVRRTFLFTNTQHPLVYRLQSDMLGRDCVHPKPSQDSPERIVQLGARVARWYMNISRASGLVQPMRYDPELLIVRGAFPDSSHGYEVESGDSAIDSWFQNSIGKQDCFICITEIRARRFVMNGILLLRRQLGRRLRQRNGVNSEA